jgi:hypothetical protein
MTYKEAEEGVNSLVWLRRNNIISEKEFSNAIKKIRDNIGLANQADIVFVLSIDGNRITQEILEDGL